MWQKRELESRVSSGKPKKKRTTAFLFIFIFYMSAFCRTKSVQTTTASFSLNIKSQLKIWQDSRYTCASACLCACMFSVFFWKQCLLFPSVTGPVEDSLCRHRNLRVCIFGCVFYHVDLRILHKASLIWTPLLWIWGVVLAHSGKQTDDFVKLDSMLPCWENREKKKVNFVYSRFLGDS